MSGRYFKLCVFGSSLFILLKPAFDLAICTCKVSWVSVTDYYRPFILREVYVSAVIRCFGAQLFCKVEHFTLLSDLWTFWYVKKVWTNTVIKWTIFFCMKMVCSTLKTFECWVRFPNTNEVDMDAGLLGESPLFNPNPDQQQLLFDSYPIKYLPSTWFSSLM
jgi:hypothetical protein